MENNKKKQPKKGVRKSIKFYDDELRFPFPHEKRNYK